MTRERRSRIGARWAHADALRYKSAGLLSTPAVPVRTKSEWQIPRSGSDACPKRHDVAHQDVVLVGSTSV